MACLVETMCQWRSLGRGCALWCTRSWGCSGEPHHPPSHPPQTSPDTFTPWCYLYISLFDCFFGGGSMIQKINSQKSLCCEGAQCSRMCFGEALLCGQAPGVFQCSPSIQTSSRCVPAQLSLTDDILHIRNLIMTWSMSVGNTSQSSTLDHILLYLLQDLIEASYCLCYR